MTYGSSVLNTAQSLPALAAWRLAGLCHGFMGRAGGASCGTYASLNLAQWVGDEPGAVATNWQRWRQAYPGARIVASVKQVHGRDVRVIDGGYNGKRPVGDGMVTATAGIVLAIFTADCVPILMVDPQRRICGAFHAGWRGTLAGIAVEGVRAMTALGADKQEIHAALGPAIGPCCFEVDSELAERFINEIPDAHTHASAGGAGKSFLDLRGILRDQLERAGLRREAITGAGPCTKCDSANFFSRRAAGGAVTGLQMSFVGFKD
jgi:purine-nucleoside/S-methyl-5'-thioadenosine phosphorylase / adenosine deaminase